MSIDRRSFFRDVNATPDDIQKVIKAFRPHLEGQNRDHAIIAMLALAINNMEPALTPQDLTKAVYQTSEYICMLLGEYEEEGKLEDPKSLMN